MLKSTESQNQRRPGISMPTSPYMALEVIPYGTYADLLILSDEKVMRLGVLSKASLDLWKREMAAASADSKDSIIRAGRWQIASHIDLCVANVDFENYVYDGHIHAWLHFGDHPDFDTITMRLTPEDVSTLCGALSCTEPSVTPFETKLELVPRCDTMH